MIGLLVYGSLIHPYELNRQNIKMDIANPVKVINYKRCFSQEPSWRSSSGINRGVLTVKTDPNEYINAILINGISNEQLSRFDQRERGYYRRKVTESEMSFYDRKEVVKNIDEIYMYIGMEKLYNKELMPNLEYLHLCLNGAKIWGEVFFRDFLNTTFIGEKRMNSLKNDFSISIV